MNPLLPEYERAEQAHNDLQFDLYKILFQISSTYIDISADKLDESIELDLRRLMCLLDIDRTMLCLYDAAQEQLISAYSIVVDGIRPFLKNLVYSQYVMECLKSGKEVIYLDRRDTKNKIPMFKPDSYAKVKDVPICSVIMFPLYAQGQFMGAFSFGTAFKQIDLNDTKRLFMRLAADLFARVLDKKAKDDRLREAYAEIIELKRKLKNENKVLRQEIVKATTPLRIIGKGQKIQKVLQEIETVSRTNASVLIYGETGTGKELFAQQIHQSSHRKNNRMIGVNCGAIPINLFESEFFGRKKGAFTGAVDSSPGKFELADNSTLFLDEIGELPLDAQAKLLRVLQEGEFERLGDTKPIRVDVRIVAATNQNLEELVKNNTFREDLFFRLNVFPITVPPLRERREDIPDLVWHFTHVFEKEFCKVISGISQTVMQNLQAYDWPGNIRELKNIVARAVIVSGGSSLQVTLPTESSTAEMGASLCKLLEVERNHILCILERTGWKVGGNGNAADLLGLNRCTLLSKMKKFNISKPASR